MTLKVKGKIDVVEACEISGLSPWRIRERCSNRPTRRGGFIRSIKVGNKRFFDKTELMEDLYGTKYAQEQIEELEQLIDEECPV